MSTADDDRIALDLLDAHLEDLWRAAVELQRGNRAVVPEVPRELSGATADGAATELLRPPVRKSRTAGEGWPRRVVSPSRGAAKPSTTASRSSGQRP
ncbi:hypothetical protein [Streptomyces sp. NPDC049949]|uniref:hypothetical protein n=1 Tax=Streptomyces sp. NPDC049949 TaxID=3154627 RepID=UPI00343AF8F2